MFHGHSRTPLALAAIVAGAFALVPAVPAAAQGNTGCQTAAADSAAKEPATKPAAKDGTSPGSAGSTGWSGGLGGSNIGTAPAGTNAGGTFQPATARGLDLAGAAKTPC